MPWTLRRRISAGFLDCGCLYFCLCVFLILCMGMEHRLLDWDLAREITGKNCCCFQPNEADCNNTLLTLTTCYEALWKSDLWCFSWLFLDSNLTICRKTPGSKMRLGKQLKFFQRMNFIMFFCYNFHRCIKYCICSWYWKILYVFLSFSYYVQYINRIN